MRKRWEKATGTCRNETCFTSENEGLSGLASLSFGWEMFDVKYHLSALKPTVITTKDLVAGCGVRDGGQSDAAESSYGYGYRVFPK